jgi:YVTN family beta-propeller protein
MTESILTTNDSRPNRAYGFKAVGAVLALALSLLAPVAQAAPFLYTSTACFDLDTGCVIVFDTATNLQVTRIPIADYNFGPRGLAVAPDGKRVYAVSNFLNYSVTVIDTATNTVAATIPLGNYPTDLVVTPDGTRVYVANEFDNNVSVINTATNAVAAVIPMTAAVFGHAMAISPDGKRVYVQGNGIAVIDTATNTVVGPPIPVPAGFRPAIAISPDGQTAYATYLFGYVAAIALNTQTVTAYIPVYAAESVAFSVDGRYVYAGSGFTVGVVIDTATNLVVAPLQDSEVWAFALVPDGKHGYLTRQLFTVNSLKVFDTATNATTALECEICGALGIIPGYPFNAYNAALQVLFGRSANTDAFALETTLTLNSTSTGINPITNPVTIQAGAFAQTIPAGSFKKRGSSFTFVGTLGGVNLQVLITPTGARKYAFGAAVQKANLTGTADPAIVRVSIGNNYGTTSVKPLLLRQ